MAKDKGAGEGSGISDEDWEAFERSFTKESTKSATYKEPSARQRELTTKWKKEPPKDTGWRTDGPHSDLRPKGGSSGPYGSGTAPGDRPWNQKKKRVWPRNLAWSLIASLIVTGILLAPKLFSSHSSSDSGVHPTIPFGGSVPGASASSSQSPSAAPSSYANADDQYFDGSPSIGWANGATGITAPPAAKVGNYSAKTVGDAYEAMQKVMVASDLDPGILAGSEPDAVFALLQNADRVRSYFDRSKTKPDRYKGDWAVHVVTRFNPNRVKLLGTTVKTHGTITAAVDKDGDLVVTGDFSFVYAVAPIHQTDMHALTLVHRTDQFTVRPGDAVNGRYWLSQYSGDAFNDRCDTDDGFVNPSFGMDKSQPSGAPVDPYATTAAPVDPSSAPSTSATPSSDPSCQAVGRI